MGIYVGKMFMTCGAQGWSEQWYMDTADPDGALTKMRGLIDVRRTLIGSGVFIDSISVSDVAVDRDSYRTTQGFTPITALRGAGITRDVVQVAWLVRLNATTQFRRQFWLRGAPDSWHAYDDTDTNLAVVPEALGVSLLAFVDYLNAQRFGMYVSNTTPQNPQQAVVGVTLDGNGYWQLNAPSDGVAVGDWLHLYGFKRKPYPGLQGRAKVKAVAGNVITLWKRGAAGLDLNNYNGSGKYRREIMAFIPFDAAREGGYQLLRLGTRRAGRSRGIGAADKARVLVAE